MLVVLLALGCAPPALVPATAGDGVLPPRADLPVPAEIAADGWEGPALRFAAPGTRAGLLLSLDPALAPAETSAAVLLLDAHGAVAERVPLTLHWQSADGGDRVLVAPLPAPTTDAALWLDADTAAAVTALGWELRVPVDEPAGPPSDAPPPPLGGQLTALGVVPRGTWGARATTCTTTESSFSKMAVHHTAGWPTSGGTVQGAVQALQSYSMGSGGYCDIPYHLLVGIDGTLWEGRELRWRGGHTANHNTGNIGVSFLGCYHTSGCPSTPDPVSDEMIASAGRLLRAAALDEGVTVNSGTVLGHREHSGASTSCPGENIYTRLPELRTRANTAPYTATFVAQTFPTLSDAPLEVEVGAAASGSFTLRNDGTEVWTPGRTFLAPVPRDAASPWAAPSWPSPTRAATVDALTAPGEEAVFALELRPAAPGDAVLRFGLVEEGVTWFADAPGGGGPGDDLIAVPVRGLTPSGGDDTAPADDTGPTPDSGDGGGNGNGGGNGGGGESPFADAGPPGDKVVLAPGCAARPGGAAPALAALGALALLRRRRTRDLPYPRTERSAASHR